MHSILLTPAGADANVTSSTPSADELGTDELTVTEPTDTDQHDLSLVDEQVADCHRLRLGHCKVDESNATYYISI